MMFQNQIFICDVDSLEYSICYDNGKSKTSKLNGTNDLFRLVANHYVMNQFMSIILIGENQQLDIIYNKLNRSNRIFLYPRELQKAANLQGSDSQQAFDTIMRSIKELKSSIEKDTRNKASVRSDPPPFRGGLKETSSFNASFESVVNDIGNIKAQIEFLIGEVNNMVSSKTNIGNNEIIENLRNELLSYKNDFYLKSMQKYGVDIAIDIISRLYDERNELKLKNGDDSPEIMQMDKLISYCELKVKKLNIQTKHSIEGCEFDGNTMIAYDDRVNTDNPEFVGRVAYSISPAFFWTLPRVNAPGEDKLLLKEEVVALFEKI